MVVVASHVGDTWVIRIVVVDIGYLASCQIKLCSILGELLTKLYVSITAKLAPGYLFAMSSSYGVR